jgi:hypothetical protein
MATRLTKLRMAELSGVDDPANEMPGWIVTKSKEWKAEVETFEKEVAGAYDGLRTDSMELYLNDAPEDVKKAHEVLVEHLSKGLESSEDEAAEEEPAKKSVKERLRNMFSSDDEGVEKAEEPAGNGEAPEPHDDEEVEAEEEPEVGDEEPSEPEDEPAEEPEGVEKADEADEEGPDPDASAEEEADVRKDIAETLAEQLEPLREAVVALADRTELLEKHAAGRVGLDGEDFSGAEGDEPAPLSKSIHAALKNGKVTLT